MIHRVVSCMLFYLLAPHPSSKKRGRMIHRAAGSLVCLFTYLHLNIFKGGVNHGAASDWYASFFTINVLFFREGRDP